MTCMEAQALITPFINDKLNIATLEQFIDHVENCKECKEELEVYHALLTAMKQLDEEEEVSADFAKELENRLKEAQERILHTKLVHIRKRILFFILVIVIGLFTSVSVSVVEEALNTSKEASFNTVVIQNQVLAPYMDDVILNDMVTYHQLQEDVERFEDEKKQQAALEEEEAQKRLEAKRIRERNAAVVNAKNAIAEAYHPYGKFSRQYEEASELMKQRLETMRIEEDAQEIVTGSLVEYSR